VIIWRGLFILQQIVLQFVEARRFPSGHRIVHIMSSAAGRSAGVAGWVFCRLVVAGLYGVALGWITGHGDDCSLAAGHAADLRAEDPRGVDLGVKQKHLHAVAVRKPVVALANVM